MRSQIKCPKCKKIATFLREVWVNHTIEFTTDENGFWDGKSGNLVPKQPISVIAGCECGHNWKLHKITQITEVVNHNTVSCYLYPFQCDHISIPKDMAYIGSLGDGTTVYSCKEHVDTLYDPTKLLI